MFKQKSAMITLEPTTELRVITNKKFTIQLISGLAEIFGSELPINEDYNFNKGGKFAVFTWRGCTLLLTGNIEDAYIPFETPMLDYFNIHLISEEMRHKAARNDGIIGPRVMIVGPSGSGKSTLCKMLLNWAARVGQSPIFVDLNVSQNDISLPGTISALVIKGTSQEYKFDSQVAFHFGYKTPNENPVLYKALISSLKDKVNKRLKNAKSNSVGGIIINTSGWI